MDQINLAQGLFAVLLGLFVGGFIIGASLIVRRTLEIRRTRRWNRQLRQPSAISEPEDERCIGCGNPVDIGEHGYGAEYGGCV